MSTISNNRKEKSFKRFLEFSTDVRLIIIDEMPPTVKCRFTRCSKMCQKEAQKSKNYIYSIKFDGSFENRQKIFVQHDDHHLAGYQLIFETDSDKKLIRKVHQIDTRPYSKELWREELDRSTDIVQLAYEHFQKLLQLYQNSIKEFKIKGQIDHNFEIRGLNSLEKLEMSTYVENIIKIISKRRKPLNEFEYFGQMDRRLLEADQFIYRVQNRLVYPMIKLNYDQFTQLSAANVNINIGDLTPNDIFNFITSWQNNEVCSNFQSCYWDLNNSNFKIHELWDLFAKLYDPKSRYFEIKHKLETGRFAVLCHYAIKKELLFKVIIN